MRHLEQIGEGDNNHQCLGEDCSLAPGVPTAAPMRTASPHRGSCKTRWTHTASFGDGLSSG